MHLSIDKLHLRFSNAAGHEHRVRPITRRAFELLRLRLRDRLLISGVDLGEVALETLTIPAVGIDLRSMSDEAVAEKIAQSMYASLHARWQES